MTYNLFSFSFPSLFLIFSGLTTDPKQRMLQQKYFPKNVNSKIPILSFVGRVVEQKGVHLILETVEQLMNSYGSQIQFLVGGPANRKDEYASRCASKMEHLKRAYPNNFWANPDEFFGDGLLVNLGSDFALMPSLFEPSGVVQQEYFAAGTPVIAFKTGGLKDTVFEGRGPDVDNGFTFEAHAHKDFFDAISRAIAIFSIPEKYEQLRQTTSKSVLDMFVVARAWSAEFARLRRVIWSAEEDDPLMV